jgi:tetratricopeptide (TPR) repeat protein
MRLVACAGLLAGVVGLTAAEPERFDHAVREDIFAGFNGDAARLARGLKTCEDKLAADPKHAEALVWRGAVRVFQAGDLFQKGKVADGRKLWDGGLADMDRAVELQPNSIGVRIPRAAVLTGASAYAPPAMARPLLEKLRGDMEHSLKLHGRDWDAVGDHPKGEVRMALAYAYRRLGQPEKAKEQLERVKAELPGSRWAERADDWLKAKPDAKLTHTCIGCHKGG